ncbi:acyl transferase [Arenibacter sp. 6A1]|uniref:LuxE/PaaK family acyltransferase n=1 Tax=Arenibacter sp. 6A1 TaxID=2720391 RepID=UPI001446E3D4|nr:acyl transferase [Arenibacter sp. 6A1]NKI26143.1 acyl transferase [Arenibacter sp. 6A1]
MDPNSIFHLSSTTEFNALTLEVFKFQYQHNLVYQEFCNHLGKNPDNISVVEDIPFLPIEFFKTKTVITGTDNHQALFTSSGTTGSEVSKHFVQDISLYEKSYLNAFKHFYGDIEEYCVLALLPSYLEREGSSLIYMAEDLIGKSKHPDSGFYLNNIEQLRETLKLLNLQNTKILLLGVSFALLDMAEEAPMALQNTIVMETGGMKGRKKEMIREELHALLRAGFGVSHIHSEYGMTELLSQAYSKGDGRFLAPNWMKVLIRETEDPLSLQEPGKTGGVNIIDLANLYSCSFIATQDLGKIHADGSFEVLGRFDHSDVRGCNLMLL